MVTKSTRRGFTLIDLHAAMAIVAVLIALVPPAVEAAREADRQKQCQNKLREIGLALQMFHDQNGKFFPPATMTNLVNPAPGDNSAITGTETTTTTKAPGFSWLLMCSRNMEPGRALYNAISRDSNRFNLTPDGAPAIFDKAMTVTGAAADNNRNRHCATINVEDFKCPSFTGASYAKTNADGDALYPQPSAPGSVSGTDPKGNDFGVAGSNYVALVATHIALVTPNDPTLPNGTIIPGKGKGYKDVVDGTSQTLMVTETREEAITSWYDGTVPWLVAANPNDAKNPVNNVDPNGYWTMGAGAATALNVGPKPKNSVHYMPKGTMPKIAISWDWGPSSEHPGIVNHLIVDGSVRGISDSIDPTLYLQLVTRAGREPVHLP